MNFIRFIACLICFLFFFGFSYQLNHSQFSATQTQPSTSSQFSMQSFLIYFLPSNFFSNSLNISLFSGKKLKTIGFPLNYQNPFKYSEGTVMSFFLNDVSDSLKFSISFFNIFGEKIKVLNLVGNDFDRLNNQEINGELFYNYKYTLQSKDFNYKILTPGVYFYIIQSDDFFIGKGKMGIIP